MQEEALGEGTYLYCVANHGRRASFGSIGLDNAIVHAVPFRDIAAVVHPCRADPYRTDDPKKAKRWILAHQYVVDLATARFGTVIPSAFDTIFRGGESEVEGWLEEEYEQLIGMLRRFRGKAEYGVKVYIDEGRIKEALDGNTEILKLRKSLEDKPDGFTYLMRKRLEQRERVQRQVETSVLSEKILKEITGIVDEMKIDGKKLDSGEEYEGKAILLSLSCLVKDENVDALGSILGDLNGSNSLAVRFTGPWPPYSFISGLHEGR